MPSLPWFDLNWKAHRWIWHWLTGNHFLGAHLRPFVHRHQIVDGSQNLNPCKLIPYACVESPSEGNISIGRDWLFWALKARWIKLCWILKYLILHMSSIGHPEHLHNCELYQFFFKITWNPALKNYTSTDQTSLPFEPTLAGCTSLLQSIYIVRS